MKGLIPLVLGIFGTFTFSWVGLTVIPNLQIGHLDPQMDEEGTDVYPAPKSGMTERGSHVFAANDRRVDADLASPLLDRCRRFGGKLGTHDRFNRRDGSRLRAGGLAKTEQVIRPVRIISAEK